MRRAVKIMVGGDFVFVGGMMEPFHFIIVSFSEELLKDRPKMKEKSIVHVWLEIVLLEGGSWPHSVAKFFAGFHKLYSLSIFLFSNGMKRRQAGNRPAIVLLLPCMYVCCKADFKEQQYR